MIQQAESKQDKTDDTMSEEEIRKEFEEEGKIWAHIYNALIFFVLGLLSIFAPAYIQTDIYWVVLPAIFLCLLCWAICCYHIHRMYPDLLNSINGIIGVCLFTSALGYIVSELGGNPPGDPYGNMKFRIASFLILIPAVLFLTIRIPRLVYYCAQRRNKIKAFFTAKHTAGLVLGILAVGTALFQFIQVVLQIFYR